MVEYVNTVRIGMITMRLGIIVPCYNEEMVIPETARQLCELLNRLITSEQVAYESRIYFIDDGSTDETWALIERLSQENRLVSGAKLSTNYGHQNALLAGLFSFDCDAYITVDADLQDDINVIEQMVSHYKRGCQIVYGVRKLRDVDTTCKRVTA